MIQAACVKTTNYHQDSKPPIKEPKMFTIETEKYELELRFQHRLPEGPFPTPPGTACFMYIHSKKPRRLVEFSSGFTYLHKDDQYSRPIGRKLALARAIQSLIPRHYVGVRRMIWDEYFKTISPKRGTL